MFIIQLKRALSHIQLSLLVALLCVRFGAAQSQRPSEVLLSTLPASVNQSVVYLEGPIDESIRDWALYLNDELLYRFDAKTSRTRRIRLALPLRPGGNAIEIEETANGKSVLLRREIYRSVRDPQRYVLVVAGDGDSSPKADLKLSTLFRAFTSAGVQPDHIMITSGGRKEQRHGSPFVFDFQPSDQLFIYYKDSAARSESPLNAAIEIGNYRGSLGSFLNYLDSIPDLAVTVLMDLSNASIGTRPNLPESPTFTRADQNQDFLFQGSTSDLSGLDSVDGIVIYPPKLVPNEDFTELFGALINDVPKTVCSSVKDLLSRRGSTAFNVRYISTSKRSSPFCLGSAAGQGYSARSTRTGEDLMGHLRSALTVDLPYAREAWIEVVLDGVSVRRVFPADTAKPTQQTISIDHDPGKHRAEIVVGQGSVVSSRLGLDIGDPDAHIVTLKGAHRLHAEILEPSSAELTTSETSLSLEASVGDFQDLSVEYAVRNNGVLLDTEQAAKLHHRESLNVLRRFPLSLGRNNLVLEVRHGEEVVRTRLVVARRQMVPIHAIIIGPDQYAGSTHDTAIRIDAEAVRSFLLRFTDVVPSSIRFLAGRAATKDAIEAALIEAGGDENADIHALRGNPDGTLVIYYSGLAATYPSYNGTVQCALPSDFIVDDPSTCLPIDRMMRAAAQWPQALVLFDSSFEGFSGISPVMKEADEILRSRTFKSYLSKSSEQLVSTPTLSAIAGPTEMLISASGSNSSAFESTRLQEGVFTSNFIKSVVRQSQTTPTFDLVSVNTAAALASEFTAKATGDAQVPTVAGSLRNPFIFRFTSNVELVNQAETSLKVVERDVRSMRPLNRERLSGLRDRFEKAVAINPDDVTAAMGLSRTLILDGSYEDASKEINVGLSKSSNTQARAEWLVLSSQLALQKAELNVALTAAKAAYEADPENSEASQNVAYLTAAVGNPAAAAAQFRLLLKTFQSQSTKVTNRITDDEAGKAVVWLYLSEMLMHNESTAKALLTSFAYENMKADTLINIASNSMLWPPSFYETGKSIRLGKISSQDEWSHAVARYLLNPVHYAGEMKTYMERHEKQDEKDQVAFDCSLHFYFAMEALLQKDLGKASEEFLKVVETHKEGAPEFWWAKNELMNLSARSK